MENASVEVLLCYLYVFFWLCFFLFHIFLLAAFSEGQRRRVQILIGLVRPFDILLLVSNNLPYQLFLKYQTSSFLPDLIVIHFRLPMTTWMKQGEITSSLDLVVRQGLLDWLNNESIKRNATIIYATHIFDGMEEWPTHVQYMKHDGTTGWQGTFEELNLYRHLPVKGRYLLTFLLMKVNLFFALPQIVK